MSADKLDYAIRGAGITALVSFLVFGAVPVFRWCSHNDEMMSRTRIAAAETRLRQQVLRHHGLTATVTCTRGNGAFFCVARAPVSVQYFQCSLFENELCMPANGASR